MLNRCVTFSALGCGVALALSTPVRTQERSPSNGAELRQLGAVAKETMSASFTAMFSRANAHALDSESPRAADICRAALFTTWLGETEA
jgi:hypothetical protein